MKLYGVFEFCGWDKNHYEISKLIGIFTSEEKAQEVLEKYSLGNDYSIELMSECGSLEEVQEKWNGYELNTLHQGFLEEIRGGKK